MPHETSRLTSKHLHQAAWSALGHLRCPSLPPWHGVRQQIPTHRCEISVGYLGVPQEPNQAGQHLRGRCDMLGLLPQEWNSSFVLSFQANTHNFCGKGCSIDVLPVSVWVHEHTGNSKTPSTAVCAVMATENFGAFRGAKWPYQHFPCLWKMCLKVTRPKNNILEYV